MAARQPSGTASTATSRHQPLVRPAASAAFCDARQALGSAPPYRSRPRHGMTAAPIPVSNGTRPGRRNGGTIPRVTDPKMHPSADTIHSSVVPVPRPSRPHRAGITHPSVAERSAENRFLQPCPGQCSHRPVGAVRPRLGPPAVPSISGTSFLLSGSAENRTVHLPRICSLLLPASCENGADGPPPPATASLASSR